MGPPPRAPAAEISLVLLGFGLLLVASPLRLAWANAARSWLTPFLVWAALVGLAALAARSGRGS